MLSVTAFFGNVVLDLRDAVLQSQRVTIYATAVAGQVRLIVPAGRRRRDGRKVVHGHQERARPDAWPRQRPRLAAR